MVVELKPMEVDAEPLVVRVFLKAIDLLGGFQKLAEFRTLTWLPSLARASFAVVLREEYLKTEEEIAEIVGLTRQTVRNILRADPELALYKIEHIDELTQEEKKELRVHTAGGIAKLAYKLVKEGHEEARVFLEYCTQTAMALDIPWAYMILKRIKGIHFPINSSEALKGRLSGLMIKGRRAEEVIEEIDFPVKNPAELLHRIKENLKMHGID